MTAPRHVPPAAAAIVLAGGAGTRLQAHENKVYLPVGGRPLLAWSLAAFAAHPRITDIVLVIRNDDRDRAEEALAAHPVAKLSAIVPGGAARHDSEYAGLTALAAQIERGLIGLVCIHDAARPFVRADLLTRVLDTAEACGGAIPGLPLEPPVLLHADGMGGAASTVDTADLRRVQTPQAFRAPDLLSAFRDAERAGFSGVDTAETVARFSDLSVEVVTGDPDNVKVTFVEDLFAVEALAEAWSE